MHSTPITCKWPVMQKQQFGRSANGAAPGTLDDELEAAYRQFGRALGETPRETSKVASSLITSESLPAYSSLTRRLHVLITALWEAVQLSPLLCDCSNIQAALERCSAHLLLPE